MFNVSMLFQVKYQIAQSETVIGVDQPMKAHSMHIQKPN